MAERTNHTAAYKIFNYNFWCYIKNVHAYPTEFIRQWGLPTTLDPAYDRDLAQADVRTCRTIAQMAELLHEGVEIRLENPAEAKRIYDYVYQHFLDMAEKFNTSVFMSQEAKDEVLGDLEKLNFFAERVYPVAQTFGPKEIHGNTLLNKLTQMSRRNRLLQPKTETEEPRKQHGNFMDYISPSASSQPVVQMPTRVKRWR